MGTNRDALDLGAGSLLPQLARYQSPFDCSKTGSVGTASHAANRAFKTLCIVAATLCMNPGGAANENEVNRTRPPYHPYLEPAPSLGEMETGNIVERAIARAARALFPDPARGSLPATDFGTIILPSFLPPYALQFRETDGGTVVEKREFEFGVRLDDLTPDERPGLDTATRLIHPATAMACASAIRRALRDARPHHPGKWIVLDGVSYYFFNRDGVGRAHSPGTDTQAGQLAQLVHVLREFVDNEAEERELQMAVENALRAHPGSATDR